MLDTTPKVNLRTDAPSFGWTESGGPNVASFTLDNGLDVVVIPDHRVPVATHMVWYRNGSADDPLGQSGIAHFLEHLMFKGTEKHPAGRVLEGRLRPRRPGERLHLVRLHRLFPARRARASRHDDGLRGRSDDEPAPRRVPSSRPRGTSFSRSAGCVSRPILLRNCPKRWRRRSSSITLTAFRSSAGCTRSRNSTARTRCPTIGASTRRKTRSSSLPAMSSRTMCAASPRRPMA